METLPKKCGKHGTSPSIRNPIYLKNCILKKINSGDRNKELAQIFPNKLCCLFQEKNPSKRTENRLFEIVPIMAKFLFLPIYIVNLSWPELFL